jgi:hypothetical protein
MKKYLNVSQPKDIVTQRVAYLNPPTLPINK